MNQLSLQNRFWRQMCAHASEMLPEEACGLLAGKDEQVLEVIPVENVLHSPVKYKMDPADQLRVFNRIEGRGLELVGIFHSHPLGPDHPSETDISEAYYPDSACVILYLDNGAWKIRAYTINASGVKEISILILEDI